MYNTDAMKLDHMTREGLTQLLLISSKEKKQEHRNMEKTLNIMTKAENTVIQLQTKEWHQYCRAQLEAGKRQRWVLLRALERR